MFFLFFGIAGGVIVVDLLTKFIMSRVEFVQIIPNVFSFNYIENDGVAFSWGSGNAVVRWVVVVFAVLVVLGGITAFVKYKRKTKFLAVAGGLFIGGTVGNLVDRIIFGSVRDFIYLQFVNNTSNLADLGITVGCVLLGIYFVFLDKGVKK